MMDLFLDKDYENMSPEELRVENEKYNLLRDEIRAFQKKLIIIRERKVAEETAKQKVAAMSDVEKVALAQVLSPESIKSKEGVVGLG